MWFLKVSNLHKIIIVIFIFSPLAALFLMLNNGSNIDEGTIAVVLIMMLPSLINYIILKGLNKRKDWARVLSILVGVILIPFFPVGSIPGVLIIFQMAQENWHENI